MIIQNMLGGGRQCQCPALPPLPPQIGIDNNIFAKIYIEIDQNRENDRP